jgi:hypothetical protein
MKCIHCGTNSLRSARMDGRCPKCRHPFAFEPGNDRDRVTDGQLQNAIVRVSGGGTVRFTERQLWYEFNRRWTKPGFWRAPFGVLPFLGAGLGLALQLGLVGGDVLLDVLFGLMAGIALGAGLSALANRLAPRQPRQPRIRFASFKHLYLKRWHGAHGPVPGLLPGREAALPAMPRAVTADVAAFSFDRAIVTDTWEMADMLVANGFHFEHNCAVLSHDGYPDGIADTVKEMLRRNPRLTVFALHDATPGGCLLPITLGEPEWFSGARIVDLGLRPGMVRRLRIPALAGARVHPPARLAEILPAKDVAWLARGYTAELAAVRPEQVLRAAYRGIVAAGPGDGSSGGGDGPASGAGGDTYYGGIIWVGDLGPGTDTAAVDGFG